MARPCISGGVIAALLLIGSPASALTMVATYTGLVTDSTFGGGDFFGLSPGATLDGQAVSVRVLYDTALGERQTYPGLTDQLYGGGSFGTTSPILSFGMTINGHTEELADPYYGFAMAEPQELRQSTSSFGATRHASLSVYNAGDDFATDLEATVPLTILTGLLSGDVIFGLFDCTAPDCGQDDGYVYGNVRLDTMAIAPAIAPVPLPATLAGLVAGLLALGLAGRRRPA